MAIMKTEPPMSGLSPQQRAEADRLLNKINKTNNNVIKSYSDDVAASAEFLETNGERLKDQGYALNQGRQLYGSRKILQAGLAVRPPEGAKQLGKPI